MKLDRLILTVELYVPKEVFSIFFFNSLEVASSVSPHL